MTGALVLVTGAAGFIGRHTVAALREAGYRVRALVRSPGASLPAGVEQVPGEMRDAASLQAAVAGCAAVIHLAAETRDGPQSDEVNVGGAQRLIEACRAAGCRRLVAVSSQSAKIRIQGDYARTKAAADRLFLASGLDVTVLLPSIVYGNAQDGIFGTLHRVVSRHRWIPVLGDGRWRSAPVHVDDVARAMVACLAADASIGRCYDIGGPDPLSFDDLLDRLAQAIGRPAPAKLHVPYRLSLAAAGLLARLMRSPPISRSNVLGSNQDTQIDIAPARRDLGFDPMPLAAGLARIFPPPDDGAALRAEACALGRYLLGADVPAELAERYVAAHRRLLPAVPDRMTAFARRHPGALPLLDAAAAWRGTRPPLRRRVLLMATVLEATTDHAERFLPAPRSRAATLAAIAGHGLRALLLALAGLPLYAWLREPLAETCPPVAHAAARAGPAPQDDV